MEAPRNKKRANAAEWAKKQMVDILKDIGMLIEFKMHGHMEKQDEAAMYGTLISRDIRRRMDCLLSTITNLGALSINEGPFLSLLKAYNNADNIINKDLAYIDVFGVGIGNMTRNQLHKKYSDVSEAFSCLRYCIDDIVKDSERELEEA